MSDKKAEKWKLSLCHKRQSSNRAPDQAGALWEEQSHKASAEHHTCPRPQPRVAGGRGPATQQGLNACATQCHQPSPTVGSLMSDCWHRCDLGAISSSLHILKGPKSGTSPSVPHWSQRRCTFPCWLHLHRCLASNAAKMKQVHPQRNAEVSTQTCIFHWILFLSYSYSFFWKHLLRSDKNEILFCSWIVVYWHNN